MHPLIGLFLRWNGGEVNATSEVIQKSDVCNKRGITVVKKLASFPNVFGKEAEA